MKGFKSALVNVFIWSFFSFSFTNLVEVFINEWHGLISLLGRSLLYSLFVIFYYIKSGHYLKYKEFVLYYLLFCIFVFTQEIIYRAIMLINPQWNFYKTRIPAFVIIGFLLISFFYVIGNVIKKQLQKRYKKWRME